MSLLSVTYTFSPGGVIRAGEHNQNNTDIITWANGNIDHVNIGTITGEIEWAITTNELAIDIANTGTEGSVVIAQNGTLASGKSGLKLSSNAAQSAGVALLELVQSSASANIPTLKITDAGGGSGPLAFQVVSTTKPVMAAPSMTTAQRAAITSPVEGSQIYNNSLNRMEIYDGAFWVAAGGNSGQIVAWPGAASLPAHLVELDGSTLADNATNAYARSVLSTTWGGAGVLPDLRGRTIIGAGTGSGLHARTLAALVGSEDTAAHDHSAGSLVARISHITNTDMRMDTASTDAWTPDWAIAHTGGGTIGSPSMTEGAQVAGTTGSVVGATDGNMQPSAVLRWCMVL